MEACNIVAIIYCPAMKKEHFVFFVLNFCIEFVLDFLYVFPYVLESWIMRIMRDGILKKPAFFLFCIVVTIGLPCAYGEWIPAKYAGAFLETGVGARSLGMGGAYVAIAEDVTAIYWNPAGLVSMETLQIHAMHAERFAGVVNWDFIGAGIPLKDHLALGFGFFRLGVDGIPFTELRNPSYAPGDFYMDDEGVRRQNDVFARKYVNDHQMAFVFSFSKRKSVRFSYGGNVKVIRESAEQFGAWGIGFDFGVLVHPYREMKFGVVLLDGTSTMIAWNTGRKELISPHLKMGLAYPFRIASFEILPVLDVHVNFENRGHASQVALGKTSFDFCGGLEVNRDRIALRVGNDKGFVTAGAGLRISTVGIDYGFSRHTDLGNTHRISVTLFWNKNHFRKLLGS